MIKHPLGAWIWELAKIPTNYIERLKQQNCRRVYLKVFDGASHSMFWAHQCSKAIIDKFHNEGIEVYGWGFHYGTPDINAQVNAVRKALDCGIDGYIFDLEQEVKNPSTHNNVKNLIQAVRPHAKPGTLGYTSFGHPGLHPEIPWKLLDGLCDLALPQIYFEKFGFNNDEAEVNSCIEAHKKLGLKKPILPIFGSEEDATKPATVATLQKFLNRFPGSSIFRVPNVGQKGEAFNLNYAAGELPVQDEPLNPAKPTQALFRMLLEDSTGLLVGNLFLFDASGKQIFDAVATSGQPGYQSPDDLWKPAQGPIPSSAGLEISTEGGEIESRDISGLFFPILPYTFESPNGGVPRGGFGVYNDAGAPGTSGGIGIVNSDTYDRFCEMMANANKAGTTKIALKVEYKVKPTERSRAAAKPAKAVFRMRLANTSSLLWGNLFLFDAAGNQIFDAVATSGLGGTQGADDLWKVGTGPIPARPGLTLNTQDIHLPRKQGVNGWFFPVEPYWVNNPRGGRRGDFGVHFDVTARPSGPGSAGCIVIQNKRTFDRFRDVMAAARRAGVKQIPLQIDYPGTRSVSVRGERPAKGISINIGLNRVDPDHYQGWDGELIACENDARDMQAIANQKGFESKLILTEQATSTCVKQALTEAASQLESGDMLLLTYSGHGGQVPDSEGDEEDNLDETWILYDREILDDELYTLYGQFKQGVRICVLSDSCHSGTVTRSRLYKTLVAAESTNGSNRESEAYGSRTAQPPKIRVMSKEFQDKTYYAHQGLYRKIQKANSEFDSNNIAASVILISGCQDNQLSLDGNTNGFFTETLLEVWKQGKFIGAYRDFRRDIGLLMPPWQSPHYYTVGTPDPEFENQSPFTLNPSSSDDADSGDSLDSNWNNFADFNNGNGHDFVDFSNGNGHDSSSEDVQNFGLHSVGV